MAKTVISDKPIVIPPRVREYQEWKKLEAEGIANIEASDPRARRLAGRPHKKNLAIVPRSQVGLWQMVAKRARDVFKGIEHMAFTSKNERIRLEALRILADKLLPNAKPTEGNSKHEPISVFINNQGFVPPNADSYASPDRSPERLSSFQGFSVAPEGEENDHSDKRDNKTSTP